MCIAIGALVPACGDDGIPDDGPGNPPLCRVVSAGDPWWNQSFSDRTKMFHAEFDVTPSASSIDAMVGLGDGRASKAPKLAAIVRFNPAGTIEARAGSEYRADVMWAYQAGVRYHIRLDVDVRTHTYSVWLRNDSGLYTAIARDYPFHTEQAGVARLNNVAGKVDSKAGTLEICGFQVVADATTADGCLIVTAGDGFVSPPLPDATVLGTVTFRAMPSGPNIDAVIGLSAGPAKGVSDLATTVRFAPNGRLDVRHGDEYRADVSLPYGAENRDFRLITNLRSHTYSVLESHGSNALELARQYQFRTEQAAVSHLDHLSAIVQSPQGSVTICQIQGAPSTGVAYGREGNYAVLPLAGDQALVSDGAMTWRLDADGRILAQVARGGELAVDALGNVFIASIAGTTLTVDTYDQSFGSRWHTTETVLAGSTIQAMATDATGAVLIGFVTPGQKRVTVFRFTAGRACEVLLSIMGEYVTLDGDQPIVAWNEGGKLRIARFDATGKVVWARAFAGRAKITAMTVDSSHNVLFGGELETAMDFGGGMLPTFSHPNGGPVNGFIVELSRAGAHVFSRKSGYAMVGGIAANGTRIVLSSTERTQLRYLRLSWFDAAGTPVAGPGFDTGFGERGLGGRAWIGASGRVWWQLETQWPVMSIWPYLVVLTP
jgi:hypothetical protein